eukprot:ANDGO_01788.mRNA.1 TPR repeat-containing protein slr0751
MLEQSRAFQSFLAGDFATASSLLSSMDYAAFSILCKYYAWQVPVREVVKALEDMILNSSVADAGVSSAGLRSASAVNSARVVLILVRASSLGRKPTEDDVSFLQHFVVSPELVYRPQYAHPPPLPSTLGYPASCAPLPNASSCSASPAGLLPSDATWSSPASTTTHMNSSSSTHAISPSAAFAPGPQVIFGVSYLRTIALLLLSRHAEAVGLLLGGRKWDEVDPHETPVLLLESVAEASQGLGETKKAVDAISAAISKALEISQKGVFPYHLYATRIALYIQMKRWKAADADCRLIEQHLSAHAGSNPLYPDTIFLFHRSLILEHFGQFHVAIEAVSSAMELSPPLAIFFIRRARLLERMRRSEEAVADYSRAIELDEMSTPLALNNRGVLYVGLGEFANALQDYQRAISLDPQFVDAYANRSLLHRLMNNFDSAVQDVSTAIELEPWTVEWRKQRAELFMDQSKFQLAMDDLTRAIEMVSIQKMNGPVRNLYERRAVAFDMLGLPEAAASDREAAQSLYSCESCPHLDTCKFLKPVEF